MYEVTDGGVDEGDCGGRNEAGHVTRDELSRMFKLVEEDGVVCGSKSEEERVESEWRRSRSEIGDGHEWDSIWISQVLELATVDMGKFVIRNVNPSRVFTNEIQAVAFKQSLAIMNCVMVHGSRWNPYGEYSVRQAWLEVFVDDIQHTSKCESRREKYGISAQQESQGTG
ncbi:hypothetical protein JAAARDRAFT_50452 [Jaapia argillacea MUCL 33604]|uniref:Uncharacterized protein n=1 Tax=Jaapia argillacea MUCL 33604 TaxID=933084 RepID=A0A067PNQ5_9AGAM|nr:hypothetical protein JAAARDRAFT_50452 [Jaapia argillacea MUCL 33604]